MPPPLELLFSSAVHQTRMLRRRELTAVELLTAHLEQIEAVNPAVNAIVTLVPEAALEEARLADAALARGDDVGPLHGLPIAVKDLADTRGIRTTYGSPLFADHVPETDSLVVERLRDAGAVVVGKTNTPEFGAGSQTTNAVFGPTRNPWDTDRTCGGSSGGAAVAVACGMLPVADGSDLGGSLRNPAAFCNVVGFRPSPGRVPRFPDGAPIYPFSVSGPIARSVGDAALLLSALAGPDPRSPLALPDPGDQFRQPLARDFHGVRVAFSPDLGGLPIEPAVRSVVEGAPAVLESIGCEVVPGCPDLEGADEAFKAWRAWIFEQQLGADLDAHPDRLNPSVRWNVEQGRALSGPELAAAELRRSEVCARVYEFLQHVEFLALPVTQVQPFDVEQLYPTRIGDVDMHTYIDWMASCYLISVTELPAISIPCGFTEDGLPVGLQLVGRLRDDFGVLQLAHAYEEATGWGRRVPPVAALP
jgi:amidase